MARNAAFGSLSLVPHLGALGLSLGAFSFGLGVGGARIGGNEALFRFVRFLGGKIRWGPDPLEA